MVTPPVTVPVNNIVPSSALQGGQGFGFFPAGNNPYWNGIDFFLPGVSALSNLFDLDGSRAASQQASSQLSLDNAAREFSATESQKQRDWEKMMSDTQYQRMVDDLRKAGLNPWLAVQHGGAGSVPSGSAASSSSGSASKADNKLVMAAGLIATALRIFLMKK